jgi:uncharacterized protein (DUF1015 family)
MVDFRPFAALRYDPHVAGDAATLIAPPYDVVSDADRAALQARSAYNISHVDYPADADYAQSRRDIDEWLAAGVLTRDAVPDLYVYDQEFIVQGEAHRRRAVFGRLRLEEFEKGIVLPHEATGAAAKADRLRLLQATRVHLSPIMAMYQGVPSIGDADLAAPVLDAVLLDERHTLRPVRPAAAQAFCHALHDKKLYIADGHHRYETGINYRNEVRERASRWTGEEPENFIIAAVVDAADPGLVILPTHRLLKLARRDGLVEALSADFNVSDAGPWTDANVDALAARMQETGRSYPYPVFGAVGLQRNRLHLLTPRSFDAVLQKTPDERKDEYRRLDVTVLAHAVLPAVGYDESPEHIDYHEDARHAAEAVRSGAWDVAFLLNATPIDQVIAAADAGERLARKTTFFFPKLATGVVMLPLDAGN